MAQAEYVVELDAKRLIKAAKKARRALKKLRREMRRLGGGA